MILLCSKFSNEEKVSPSSILVASIVPAIKANELALALSPWSRVPAPVYVVKPEEFNIDTFNDKKNIGIWYKEKNDYKKVAAIGLRISKWIAYHGFSINVKNDLKKYNNIIPCGIKNKGITSLVEISNQDYKNFEKKLVDNFINNLKI